MIATVTLNPAVDQNCRIDKLCVGEVNRLEETERRAGGKGINVTRVLRKFHTPVMALGFLGGNNGKMIEEEMEELGVECFFTPVEGETRVNTNILGRDGTVTEILEPGPVITDKELQQFLRCYDGVLEQCDMVVLSGSLPAGVPGDLYAVLIMRAGMFGVKTVLDTSGAALAKGIKAVPYMIKPNINELAQWAGAESLSREAAMQEAEKLVRLGISKVVVSMGSEGLIYADEAGTFFVPAKQVEVKNSVGCGDTVVASLCMSEVAGDDPETAMEKAVAMAAANAAGKGGGEFSTAAYLELLQ